MREGQGRLTNRIGGTVEEMPLDKLVELFSSDVRDRVTAAAKLPGTEAIVLYRVLDMSSSRLGDTFAMAAGPGRTYSLTEAVAGRLGDVPSRFAYPVAFALVPSSVAV